MRQIDKIRDLYHKFSGDEEKVIRAYAAAERSGEVARVSNKRSFAPEEYARRLFYNTFVRKRSCKDG